MPTGYFAARPPTCIELCRQQDEWANIGGVQKSVLGTLNRATLRSVDVGGTATRDAVEDLTPMPATATRIEDLTPMPTVGADCRPSNRIDATSSRTHVLGGWRKPNRSASICVLITRSGSRSNL